MENNLGAFRVIQSRNKCSDPEPTLVRAIPFRRNYPKLGHMKGQFCLHILLVGVNNETDAHAFQFLIKYCEEKGKLKIGKII